MDWTTIATSAAVGALVSSAVQLVGQSLERRSRRKELIFKAVMDHAERVSEKQRFVLEGGQRDAYTEADPIVLAAKSYSTIERIFDEGTVSAAELARVENAR